MQLAAFSQNLQLQLSQKAAKQLQDNSTYMLAETEDRKTQALYLASHGRDQEKMLYLYIVMDVSRSMDTDAGPGGTRLDVAMSCVEQLCSSDVVADHDSLRVFNFARETQFGLGCSMKRFKYEKYKGDLLKMDNDLRKHTAVREGVVAGINDMLDKGHGAETHKRGKEIVRYLLVFTDGEDNCSKTSRAQLEQLVRHSEKNMSNFHLQVISCGVDVNRMAAAWGGICNTEFSKLTALQSASQLDITQAFADTLMYIRQIVIRHETKTGKLVTNKLNFCGKKAAAEKFDNDCVALISRFDGIKISAQGKLMQLQPANVAPLLQLLGQK